jgi:hypothetical protein
MTAPRPWSVAWSETSVTILDANGGPVGMFPNDGRADAQDIVDTVNTDVLTTLRRELKEVRVQLENEKALNALQEGDVVALGRLLEYVRQTVLISYDDGFFAGNAGRGWDATPGWLESRAKKRLEVKGLSTEMPKALSDG